MKPEEITTPELFAAIRAGIVVERGGMVVARANDALIELARRQHTGCGECLASRDKVLQRRCESAARGERDAD